MENGTFLIEPLQFYNSYVTNNYAKNKSAKYVMMKGEGTDILYMDLLGIKSVDALCKRMLRAIVTLRKKSELDG
jgi:hypothetical protein